MSNITVPKKDIYFWIGFYNDEDCCSWASNKAYLDMNRTMTFKDIPKNDSQQEKDRVDKQRKEWRDKVTEAIRNGFSNQTNDFERWHRDICTKLIEVYGNGQLVSRDGKKRTNTSTGLMYGQAQKWVNMTLKYLWLLNRLNLINDPNISTFIKKHEKTFHVPLDSYILKYVARRDKSKKEPFSPKNNNALTNVDFNPYWELFNSTWSAIENEDKYYEYQSKLASAIENNISPLEWELEHWHKALKYYG